MSELTSLRQLYGDIIELEDDENRALPYHIVAELSLNAKQYVILQSETDRQDDTFEVFQVAVDAEGEVQLETVVEDDEWEAVAEAYDDMQFGNNDQP
ncbi:MAG: DUF1292 domain-containing protein [Candidatus Cohnella colombiensis]|uniref:DUF1292 domain-containing protein n=1 Tax=Candidatus Cohnella colombiensis TaxID=3121368 RepID=A0AA95ETG8_9BACL|nr:MAG: DUF1292 domain-containing protein [Cohnella sp.]